MAVAWLLKDKRVTSVLVGVSKVSQLKDNLATMDRMEFTPGELEKIENILKQE
jgi:L-glyceraldehyde 3-phosphate reductase